MRRAWRRQGPEGPPVRTGGTCGPLAIWSGVPGKMRQVPVRQQQPSAASLAWVPGAATAVGALRWSWAAVSGMWLAGGAWVRVVGAVIGSPDGLPQSLSPGSVLKISD